MSNKDPLLERLMFPYGVKPGTPHLDPFGNPRTNPLDPVGVATPEEAARQKAQYQNPVPILFPRHMAAPEGAETVDINRLALFAAAELNTTLLEFTCPEGATTVFYGYAVFTDAVAASNVLFTPTVDGKRIMAYHGDPLDNFKINLSITGDLSNVAMKACQVFLQPKQTLRWVCSNFGPQASLGVRMAGYLDFGQRLTSSKIGG